jgi:hypothetical protein
VQRIADVPSKAESLVQCSRCLFVFFVDEDATHREEVGSRDADLRVPEIRCPGSGVVHVEIQCVSHRAAPRMRCEGISGGVSEYSIAVDDSSIVISDENSRLGG